MKKIAVICLLFTLFSNQICEIQTSKPYDLTERFENPILIIEANILNLGTNIEQGMYTYLSVEPTIFISELAQTHSSSSIATEQKINPTKLKIFIQDEKSNRRHVFKESPIYPNRDTKDTIYTVWTLDDPSSFHPEPNKNYTLSVIYNGMTYKSTVQQTKTPQLDNVNVELVNRNRREYSVSYNFTYNNSETSSYFYAYLYHKPYGMNRESGKIVEAKFLTNEPHSIDKQEEYNTEQKFKSLISASPKDTIKIFLINVSPTQAKILQASLSPNDLSFSRSQYFPRSNIKNITNPDRPCIGYFSINNYVEKTYTIP